MDFVGFVLSRKIFIDDGSYFFRIVHVKMMGAVDSFIVFIRCTLLFIVLFELFPQFSCFIQQSLFRFNDFEVTS